MKFSWYFGTALATSPGQLPYLTGDDLEVGSSYTADGPDGIGDQYFQAVRRQDLVTWLVASSFPNDVSAFQALPIARIRILEPTTDDAIVRVEACQPLGTWIRQMTLGSSDGIGSVAPEFLAEEPLSVTFRQWPADDARLWVCPEPTYHPLKRPYRLKAVLSVPTDDGRRLCIVPFSAESCFLVRE